MPVNLEISSFVSRLTSFNSFNFLELSLAIKFLFILLQHTCFAVIFKVSTVLQFFAYRTSEKSVIKIAGFQSVQILSYAAIWRIWSVKPYVNVHILQQEPKRLFFSVFSSSNLRFRRLEINRFLSNRFLGY